MNDRVEERASAAPSKGRIALFVLATVALFFLVSEAALRLLYRPLPPPQFQAFVNPEWKHDAIFAVDRRLFWRFLPDRTILGGSEKRGEYRIAINPDGYRGPVWTPERPNSERRILILGDSCVFGWDAPEGENFPERLERRLEVLPPFSENPPTVFQRGVPGYTSHQALILLEDWGPEIRPEWVILFVGTNDVLPRIEKNDREISETTRPNRIEPLLQKSYTALAVRDFLFLFLKNTFWEREFEREVDFDSTPERVPLDQFEANLREIEAQARTLGATPVYLTRQHAVPHPKLETYNDVTRRVASTGEGVLVDVAARFVEYASSEVYANPSWDHVHPNETGYDLIAEWTAEAMAEAFSGASAQ